MAEQWLIDGYNLLYATKLPSREQLFALVAEFASFKKIDVLLVLDGTGDDQELQGHGTDYFQLVYSQKVPADTFIEKHLFDHRGKRRLVVVTNDRAIGNIACGSGAGLMSTALFWEQLQASKKENQEISQKRKAKEHGFHRPFEDKLKDL